MKKNVKIILIIGILLIAGIGAYFYFFNEKIIIKEFPIGTECNETYLGFCYNQSSPAYGCDMKTETCDEKELMLVTFINSLEVEGIKIYGTTTCPYCKKQLEGFGKHGDYLLEKGMFVYCDIEPMDPECYDIESVPTWKQNGNIFQVGYLDLEELISTTLNQTNIQ